MTPMTERILSQIQAAEIGFLGRVQVTLSDKVRSCKIRKALNIEALLRVETSQLRWFGHVTRMPQERLARPAGYTNGTGKRPICRPRTRWRDYAPDLAWPRLSVNQENYQSLLKTVRYFHSSQSCYLATLPRGIMGVKMNE